MSQTSITPNKKRGGGATHESFLVHRRFRYFKVAVVLIVVAVVGYFMADVEPRHNGGTWYGYTLGTLSAGLIVWLTMLGVRKRSATPGKWSLKGWTSAHVYLGLSLTVLATLHTGFQFGWNVHTLAYVLMMLVIGSGLFGIYYYVRIPQRMSDNRAETSQAEMLAEINGLDRDLREAAQPLSDKMVAKVEQAITKTRIGGGLMTRITARDRSCATRKALVALRRIAQEGPPATMREPLANVISLLERKSVLLKRARYHIRYRSLLELWLFVHIPATIVLLVALAAHIISVFFYW